MSRLLHLEMFDEDEEISPDLWQEACWIVIRLVVYDNPSLGRVIVIIIVCVCVCVTTN